MNEKKYRILLYFILTTMLLTIGVQGYWNYKNYQQNKQNFINQVQISLDNALENYYANLAEANHMTFIDIESDTLNMMNPKDHFQTDSIFIALQKDIKNRLDEDISGYTQLTSSDSGFTYHKSSNLKTQVKVIKGKKAADSIKLLKGITSIYISFQDDSLNFETLNPLLKKEFERKKISIPFALTHFKNDSVFNWYNDTIVTSNFLKTSSKTKFLKGNESLELAYPNATRHILMQGLSGILLSLLLTIAIISCLFYLLKIIKHQKQLAEVKNDLISNITHEFKTPIATIGVALESIKNFNVIDNKEKTKTYLEMSNNQLSKLNVMVEKLLETATLDSDNLKLVKEAYNITDLITALVNKHQIQTNSKTLKLHKNPESIFAQVDVFHFENAINNILDNAIKYGGSEITIDVNQNSFAFTISISDNGTSPLNSHKDKIFEKFYRIPKGNTHDVKGFGIGLYYTKTIIEKHNGTIILDLSKSLTTFKITLPNA